MLLALFAPAPASAADDSVRASGNVTTAALPDELTVRGHGYGHGRGMGQYGSLGYATGITGEYWGHQRILAHYYGGTAVGHAENRLMSVLLKGRPAGSAMVVYRQEGLRIAGQADTPTAVRVTPLEQDSEGVWEYNLQTGTSCTGPWSANQRIVKGPVRVSKLGTGTRALRLCNGDGSQVAYAHDSELVAIDDKTVNLVRLEEMLRGIVPRESPASWGDAANGRGMNALRAQAVAARGYALAGDTRWGNLHSRLGAGATTCDDQYCQVYGGVAYVSPTGAITNRFHANTDRAIAETGGEVRRFPDGRLARTEFSSSTGGWTAGGDFPVVQDLGDAVSSNPNHTWTTTLTRQRIEAKYPAIGALTDIQFIRRNGVGDMGGRVLLMRLIGTRGNVDRTGNQFRIDFGLKSDWFTVTVPAPSTPPPRPITTACPSGQVPRGAFTDVDPASTHALAIDCMAWRDIAEGRAPGIYAPQGTVTRAQMASFVTRLILEAGGSLPTSFPDAFDDDNESTHELSINRLAAADIIEGTGPRTFDPQSPVTRAQVASLLARAVERVGVTLPASPPSVFRDDNGSVHEKRIDQLAAVGVVTGTAPGTFQPGASAKRDQMATMLARALDLSIS